MRKISLDIEALDVESFATEEKKATREGTVHAHASFPRWCTNHNTVSETWGGWGCDSVSGEHACICQPSMDGETCMGGICVDTWNDTCECIP